MELREAIGIYRARRPMIVMIVGVVVAGAYLWAYFQPIRYETSTSFAVNRVNKTQTADYEFDGYYALQSADLIADTVISLLQTPSVLTEIYDQAGIDIDPASFGELTSRFTTKKFSAQNIVLTFSSATDDEAKRLAQTTAEVMRSRVDSLNRSADNLALYELAASEPVILRAKPNPVMVGLGSAFAGLILALFLVPFVNYLAPRSVEHADRH